MKSLTEALRVNFMQGVLRDEDGVGVFIDMHAVFLESQGQSMKLPLPSVLAAWLVVSCFILDKSVRFNSHKKKKLK
jgi:hypothetical protein